MTTQPEQPKHREAADRVAAEHDHAGTDPMHPHPQDRPRSTDADRGVIDDTADHAEDDAEDDAADEADEDTRDAGQTDDESPVDRYGDSPGLAASRPMNAPGDVPEPNEPA